MLAMVKSRRAQLTNRPWFWWCLLGPIAAVLVWFWIDWAIVWEWWGGDAARNSGQAAWVQAIGTLAALAIAIGVPWYIHKNESRERAADRLHQAQGVSLLISGPLMYLKGEIEREQQVINKNGYTPNKGECIEVPVTIKEQADRLWLMGEAGGHVLQLISTLETDERFTKESFGPLSSLALNIAEVAIAIDLRKERLELAREAVTEALVAINNLLTFKS